MLGVHAMYACCVPQGVASGPLASFDEMVNSYKGHPPNVIMRPVNVSIPCTSAAFDATILTNTPKQCYCVPMVGGHDRHTPDGRPMYSNEFGQYLFYNDMAGQWCSAPTPRL